MKVFNAYDSQVMLHRKGIPTVPQRATMAANLQKLFERSIKLHVDY